MSENTGLGPQGALRKNTQNHAQSSLMQEWCDVSISWGKNNFLQITENQKCFPGSKNQAIKKESRMNDKQIEFTFSHVALSHRVVHTFCLSCDSKNNGFFATWQKVCVHLAYHLSHEVSNKLDLFLWQENPLQMWRSSIFKTQTMLLMGPVPFCLEEW